MFPLHPRGRERNEVRMGRVRGFPYTIPFRPQGAIALVVAVAHHKRRPDYWLARLRR
jgi:hypothetical protein